MITHIIDGVVRPRVAVMRHEAMDTRLDEAIALRRCALYRKAFRGFAIGYHADTLRLDAVASWMKSRGVPIEVGSTEDLDRVRLADIEASHVVMHCQGEVPVAVRRAALAGFVVDSSEQLAELADNPLARGQRIVVDQAGFDELAAEVLTHRRLVLVGLHTQLGHAELGELADSVVSMIAKMAWIRRRHGIVLPRVSLGDVDAAEMHGDLRSVRRVAEAVDQAVEDGCIRFRYPRPAVIVSPRRSLILT